jgi:hypothetical protein
LSNPLCFNPPHEYENLALDHNLNPDRALGRSSAALYSCADLPFSPLPKSLGPTVPKFFFTKNCSNLLQIAPKSSIRFPNSDLT